MAASEETIVVCLCGDDGFAMPMGVTVRSLVESLGEGRTLQIYIVDDGLTSASRERITQSAASPEVTLEWLKANRGMDQLVAGNPLGYSGAVLHRLSLPHLLPASIDKVIYLDGDVIVRGDIGELWDIDLGDHLALAVAESTDTSGDYFNAGVLVMDIAGWRDQNIGEQALDYLENHRELCPFMDQDALNHVLGPAIGNLPPMWNQLVQMYSDAAIGHPYGRDDILTARRDPRIVHYSMRPKPWEPGCRRPLTELWTDTLQRTPWQGYEPSQSSRLAVWRNRLRFWSWRARVRILGDPRSAR